MYLYNIPSSPQNKWATISWVSITFQKPENGNAQRDEACSFQSKGNRALRRLQVLLRGTKIRLRTARLRAFVRRWAEASMGVSTLTDCPSAWAKWPFCSFEIVLIDAATVEHFSKKNWCLNNSLWALYLSNVEYWSWSQKHLIHSLLTFRYHCQRKFKWRQRNCVVFDKSHCRKYIFY